MRQTYRQALESLELLSRLIQFDPVVIGTPPLGIDTESSDIDVACSAKDLGIFQNYCETEFSQYANFSSKTFELQGHPSTVVGFLTLDWEFEIFCQPIPTREQWGVRHFFIEQRLLNLIPGLRLRVRQLKEGGLKTEPAFATALGLSGDPYEAVLAIENLTDKELLSRFN